MSLFRKDRRPPLRLRFYTKEVCPLCDEMKAQIALARPRRAYELEYVRIDAEPEHRYRAKIPVVEIEGRRALFGRWTAADFEAALELADRVDPAGAGEFG